ncbi:GGDEF domain-containing protein [Ramlibacter sp. H39-3-26]|uniref:GGDEF domain-containing protein n=1 Tax=Curvibacter soli TaxID=3031331 RepID=UPI0023DA1A16|nr:GGDEF domain-containing protein [Ramlibacter sp. H39-3-26]MDF1486651.1 GGDEF domain-containing protein [Ramlibacter sp. H39-3-26]
MDRLVPPDDTSALIAALCPAMQGSGPLARLMSEGALYCVFQPLADLREGAVFAHEALIRGPENTPFHTPGVLLAMARSEQMLADFELFCIFTALVQWGKSDQPGRLFVNTSANALVQITTRQREAGTFGDLLRAFGMLPRKLVLELTEHERADDLAQFRDAINAVHASGAMLALDDFGDGHSSLKLWAEVKPNFVKIDRYFIHAISEQGESLQMVQAIQRIADVFGTTLVAEGIETRDDLRVLRDLDIGYGQGFLLGRPGREPSMRIEAPALAVIQDRRVAVLPQLPHNARPDVLRSLSVIQAPCVGLTTTNNELAALLHQHPTLHAVAVVDKDRPVALINRQQFMNHYTVMYFREVHGKKPCIAYANHAPRLVELDYDVDELVGILTSQDQRYLSDGFIVTDNGRYVGLGTGDQLVRAVTEARIEAARHANPLTFLPGNIPISIHIERLLANGSEFVACYADLNNFKPFNDQYGYWRGDEMIRLMARLALAHCDARRDFVGHVGGDDFVILFQSNDWQRRCEAMVCEFAQQAQELFDETARQAGGIQAEDRHGVVRFFPCTTVSIGAVRIHRGQYRSAEEVANEAALAKHAAKQSQSGLFVREDAAGTADLTLQPGEALLKA